MYLGIYTDSKLSWSVHVEAECFRAQKRLYTFSGISEHSALAQTYRCCSIMLLLKAWLDMS